MTPTTTPDNKVQVSLLPSLTFPGEGLAMKAIDLLIVMIESQTPEQQKLAWDRWNLLFKPLFDWIAAEQSRKALAATEEKKP